MGAFLEQWSLYFIFNIISLFEMLIFHRRRTFLFSPDHQITRWKCAMQHKVSQIALLFRWFCPSPWETASSRIHTGRSILKSGSWRFILRYFSFTNCILLLCGDSLTSLNASDEMKFHTPSSMPDDWRSQMNFCKRASQTAGDGHSKTSHYPLFCLCF